MFKSEYEANAHGFKCVSIERKQAAKVSNINVFHVVGYIVVACVLAGCYF